MQKGRRDMKKVLAVSAALALLALAVSFAGAAPRLDAGSTGLVQTPTADILDDGLWDVAAGYVQGDDFKVYPIRVLYGLGKAELGIAYANFDSDFGGSASDWQYSAKYGLLSETSTHPAVSIGADYFAIDDLGDDITRWSLYVVASKRLNLGSGGPAVIGNVGVAYEDWKTAYFDESDNFLTPFIGVDIAVAESTSVIAEYKWKQEGDWFYIEPIFSAAIRHSFAPNLLAEAGVTNFTGMDPDRRFYASVAYRFGGGY
jgi:hypothetical protein